MSNFCGGHLPAMKFFRVLEAEALETPLDYNAAGYGLEHANNAIHCITPQCEERLLNAPLQDQRKATTMEWIQGFHVDYGVTCGTTSSVMQLPLQISPLVVAGIWNDIGMEHRILF